MDIHNWIMEPNNFAVLFSSVLHMIQQNINKTSFRKNISPRLLFLAFVFNMYLYLNTYNVEQFENYPHYHNAEEPSEIQRFFMFPHQMHHNKLIFPNRKIILDVFHSALLSREREIKFFGLFGDRGHRGPHSPYKPCNHNLYIGIIIFPHIDNPQSTGNN